MPPVWRITATVVKLLAVYLADIELEAKQCRAIERRFKSSRLQAQPSIDAFHFHHHKSRVQAIANFDRL
jgi:hypothetical protein